MSADAVAPLSENRILSVLPGLDRQRLLPHLEPVRTELKQILYAPNEEVSHIYFPLNGVVSLMTIMADGSAIEVATVGNEGMIGLPAFLGAGSMPGQALAQVPGEALWM